MSAQFMTINMRSISPATLLFFSEILFFTIFAQSRAISIIIELYNVIIVILKIIDDSITSGESVS